MIETSHQAFIKKTIEQSIELKNQLMQDGELLQQISQVSNQLIDTFKRGNRLLIAGNGGSAADAQHIAAEFVCRFNFERPALPAIALATNYSVMTAAANDYSFEEVFAREIQANGQAGDLFIGLSTSGNSRNILQAIEACHHKRITTVGLSGAGGELPQLAQHCLCVPSQHTPRIQECHILIGHILCEIVENHLFARL